MKKIALALAVCALPFCGAANASTFNFTYDASFGSAFGTFQGDLDVDGDTIINMTDMVVELTTQPGVTTAGNPLILGGVWSLSGLVAGFTTGAATPAGFQILSGQVAFGDPIIQVDVYNPANATVAPQLPPLHW